MTKKTGLFLLGCLLAACVGASAAAPQTDVESADWSVNGPIVKTPPSKEAVWSFINGFWRDDEASGNLCSFRFVDLRHSGELSLVASYGAGSSVADCYQLTIFDKGPVEVEAYDYSGSLGYTNVNDVVKDINGNGHLQLIVPLAAASYCDYDWPSFYAWTGSGYTNVSSKYPKYYETWLASLKKQIAAMQAARQVAAQATPTPSLGSGPTVSVLEDRGHSPYTPVRQQLAPEPAPPVSAEVQVPTTLQFDCARAQADKIERFLGSKDAGMLDAIRWANSGDAEERKLAASIFYHIGTSEARQYEQTLSRDPDRKVAERASRDLKLLWGKLDPYYAATFDRETPDD